MHTAYASVYRLCFLSIPYILIGSTVNVITFSCYFALDLAATSAAICSLARSMISCLLSASSWFFCSTAFNSSAKYTFLKKNKKQITLFAHLAQ